METLVGGLQGRFTPDVRDAQQQPQGTSSIIRADEEGGEWRLPSEDLKVDPRPTDETRNCNLKAQV